MHMIHRPRRLRNSPRLRSMVRETRMSASALILPFFVREGHNIREPVPSMPGLTRYSPDTLPEGLAKAMDAGIHNFLLFGLPETKDATGSQAWADNGVIQQALRTAKRACPDAFLITDICLCEYTDHGHCGIVKGESVENDATLPLLARTAVSHAEAGADMVAPSDMMDGRIGAMREALDTAGHDQLPIMSYAVKYASSFYGPFREAAGSAPGFGDRKTYQMDWHNRREAGREAWLDVEEGADMLIVKPALSYLDIIADVAATSDRPVAAYSVSGEFAMIKAAAAQGLVDEYGIMCETATSIFRAGADILITYYAAELADALRKGDIG